MGKGMRNSSNSLSVKQYRTRALLYSWHTSLFYVS